ncbi:hypothetical protein FIBSPDRAFT_1050845 [Athelia psychrophila]|uniref:HNH nuclease domain-containing protein n=1 Tax=Athelia psychrophila TaxID=1759441 RepID=A0A166A2W8_9AGAM|nr:hypothetical protein FIBSPDRAFT_1050845 [Fibularhizoctonia sp. CBS 109695]
MASDHPSSQSASTPPPSSSPEYDRDVATHKRNVGDVGARSASSASSRLESHSLNPDICVLTGDTGATGSDIERALLIPRSSPGAELRAYEWLLGCKAGEFHADSHHNSMYMEYGWHHKFDRGKWALVPDKPTRDDIIARLKAVVQTLSEAVPTTSGGVALEMKDRESAWPHFEKVLLRKDKRYQYRFFNVALSGPAFIRDGKQTVDIDQELPLLPLESHVHPLYVIINAYPKVKDLQDRSEFSLEVIADICEIWDIWHSIPVAPEFLQYGQTDSNQSSGREKHDDDGADGAHRKKGNDGREEASDAVPALGQSGTSRKFSADPFSADSLAHIRSWRDTVEEAHPPTGYPEDEAVATLDDEIGSPK